MQEENIIPAGLSADEFLDHLVDLTERQKKEIRFASMYANHFDHGTSGSLSYLTIARLFAVLYGVYVNQTQSVEEEELAP